MEANLLDFGKFLHAVAPLQVTRDDIPYICVQIMLGVEEDLPDHEIDSILGLSMATYYNANDPVQCKLYANCRASPMNFKFIFEKTLSKKLIQ